MFATNSPNVNSKPTVSMIEEVEGNKLVYKIDDLKTLMFDVKKQLLTNKLSPGCDVACERCLINP